MRVTELTTDRLLLRQFRGEDAADVLAYATDEEYGRFIPVPRPYAIRDAEAFVAQAMQRPEPDRIWAIVHEGRVRGAIELDVDAVNRRGEIHYALARDLWGQGVMTEAGRAIVRYAFEELGLGRVFARADVRNIGSWRVMEKLGMQREGLLRRNRMVRGEPVDDLVYGVLREEAAAG